MLIDAEKYRNSIDYIVESNIRGQDKEIGRLFEELYNGEEGHVDFQTFDEFYDEMVKTVNSTDELKELVWEYINDFLNECNYRPMFLDPNYYYSFYELDFSEFLKNNTLIYKSKSDSDESSGSDEDGSEISEPEIPKSIINMIMEGATLEEIKEAAEEIIKNGGTLSEIYHIFAVRIDAAHSYDDYHCYNFDKFEDLGFDVSYNRSYKCGYIKYSEFDVENPKNTAEFFKFLEDNNIKYETLKHQFYTAMTCAAEHDRVDIVKLLLEMGIPPECDSKYIYFQSASKIAVERSNVELFNILMAADADIYIIESTGRTLLHVALEANNLEIFKTLIKYIKTDCRLEGGFDLLYYAVSKKCNIEIIKLLIEVSTSPISTYINAVYNVKKDQKIKKTTALGIAIKSGDLDVIKLLLDHGALAHVAYLNSAIKNGDIDLFKLLLCNVSSDGYHAILQDCVNSKNPELVKIIVESNPEYQPYISILRDAVEVDDDGQITTILLEHGFKPDHIAFDKAITKNNPSIVRQLLKYGVMISGDSLSLAVKSGNETIVKMLLDHGAKLSPTLSVKDSPVAIQRLINAARLKK